MKGMENFKQAAKELFGLDNGKNKEEAPGTEQAASPIENIVRQNETAEAPGPAFTNVGPFKNTSAPAAAPTPPRSDRSSSFRSADMPMTDGGRDITSISKGTVVTGRIRADGHVEIGGRVDGNVEASGNVVISGRVAGNIQSENLDVFSGQIRGGISCYSRVRINSDAMVVGDVDASSLIFDGKIKGNVTTSSVAVFNSNSHVYGDITSREIAVDAGAVINGMVTTITEYDSNVVFNDLFV